MHRCLQGIRRAGIVPWLGVTAAALGLVGCGSPPPAPPATFETAPRQLGAGSDPSLAIRDTGYIYLLHAGGDGNLWFEVSMDGGDSFGPPLRVNDTPGEVMSHPEATPRLVQRGGKPYALWGARTAGGVMKLHFARSTDYGESFGKSIAVDPTGPAEQSFFNLALAPDGTLWAVWLDGRDKKLFPGAASVYVARSTDGGASFGPSVRAATDACPCCRPALAFDGNRIYLGFRKVYPGDMRDATVTSSDDGGATWAAPVRVAVDNWHLNGCPHSGPSLAVLHGRLFIAWYSVHEQVHTAAVFYAYSDDQGRSFSPEKALSAGTVDANHPQLVTAGDRILAAFQGRDPKRDNGWTPLRAYVRDISADGQLSPLQSEAAPGPGVTYPYLAYEPPDHIFLAWSETDGNGEDMSLARGRLRASTSR